MEKQLNETLKPITNPLQKLIKLSNRKVETKRDFIRPKLDKKEEIDVQMDYRTKPQTVIIETMMVLL